MSRAQRALAARGARALFALPYTQAELARLLHVDTATVHQWKRRECVGESSFARVVVVPCLRDRITPAIIRPDLPRERIKAAVDGAWAWRKTLHLTFPWHDDKARHA